MIVIGGGPAGYTAVALPTVPPAAFFLFYACSVGIYILYMIWYNNSKRRKVTKPWTLFIKTI